MERVTEKSVPKCRMCSHSKPWWNNDLSAAFKDMRTAKDMAHSYYQHFNRQSNIMVNEVKQLCKRALTLVKTAKHAYYLKLTEEANPQNMWNFWKWTMGCCTYTSPALSRGDGLEPAVSHDAKCSLLELLFSLPSQS